MNTNEIESIRHKLNVTVIEKLLIQYFNDKGFEDSYDKLVYPPMLFDMIMQLPVLADKIEVIPHTEHIDQIGGKAVLGWNLFVLGNQRMYLGQSLHSDLRTLANNLTTCSSFQEMNPEARNQTTPRKIVAFIIKVLESHDSGKVDLSLGINNNLSNPLSSFRDSMNGINNVVPR